jgi:hypothetical protein
MRPSMQDISKAAALYFGVPLDELRGQSRVRRVVYPRMMAMTVAHRMGGMSLPSIGLAFGGRDHATVLSAMAKVDSLPKMLAGADGVALLAARICVDRRARESAWIYQGLKLGQMIPARVEDVA